MAATTVPMVRVVSTAMRTRRLPTMSPRRPRIGVRTDADSRYAVMTQLVSAVEVPSSRLMVGSAGTTIDWSTAKARPPSVRYSTSRVGWVARWSPATVVSRLAGFVVLSAMPTPR